MSFFISIFSRERVPGAVQGGVGEDSRSRGCLEKVAQQTLRGGAAAARPVHVREKQHRQCLRTGWFCHVPVLQ